MMKTTDAVKPLGLYLHIPFCKKKCSYCDFLTFAHAEGLEDAYIEALCREIEQIARRGFFASFFIDTVYIGGGTPTKLKGKNLKKLLETIHRCLPFGSSGKAREWTIEGNPGELSPEIIQLIKDQGVDRVSLGVQTLNPKLLSLCGRDYGEEEVFVDLEELKKAGIPRISLDFIFGLPGQKPTDIEKDLSFIKNVNVGHISWYNLILEEKTLLKYWVDHKKVFPLTEEQEIVLMRKAFEGLEDLGYKRYEISNFAKKGEESLHNLKYWSGEEYLGLGLGASSYINKERYTEEKNIHRYIKELSEGNSTLKLEKRTKSDDLFEQLMMGLRKIRGIDLKSFKEKNGQSLLSYGGEFFKKARDQGLIDWDDERLWMTKTGLNIQNLFLSDFLFYLEKGEN